MAHGEIKKVTVYKLAVSSVDDVTLADYDLAKADQYGPNKYPYRLHFLNQQDKPASWYRVFEHLQPSLHGKPKPFIMISGFVLVVQIGTSVYGVTGGIGHVHLKSAATIEHRFGIEIAERILSIPEVRGLSQKGTTGVVNQIDRGFRAFYNPHGDIDNLKRVLTHIRATLSDTNFQYETIGKSITAGDSLSVNGTKTFPGIITFLEGVDDIWKNGSKTISIPQLEHIDKRADAALVESLDDQLVETIHQHVPGESVALFLDNEEIGYLPDRVTQYTLMYQRKKWSSETVDGVFVDAREILSGLATATERLEAYRKMHLCIDLDNGQWEKKKLHFFVCGDVVVNNDVYFINNRLWYRASESFIEQLDAELENVEYITPESLGLIEWDTSKYKGRKAEYNYNKANTPFILMDCRLVEIDGQKGGIEFCDLLNEQNGKTQLVHVKHACGAALRALFAQVFVSAQLFAESEEFRQKIYDSDLKGDDHSGRTDAAAVLSGLQGRRRIEFRVVFAIFDDKKSHKVSGAASLMPEVLNGTLSTFAKVDLMERISVIRAMGYEVAVTRIKPHPTSGN